MKASVELDRTPEAIDYRIASRELLSRYGAELAELDALIRVERGGLYSTEAWTVSSFTRELPEKYRVSTIALCEGRAVGFCIASRKGDAVHIHRAGIRPGDRHRGIVTRLVHQTEAQARGIGASRITCVMSKGNSPARSILEGMGYRVAEPAIGDRLLIEGTL